MSIRKTVNTIRVEFHCTPPHLPSQVLQAVNDALSARLLQGQLERLLGDAPGEALVTVTLTVDGVMPTPLRQSMYSEEKPAARNGETGFAAPERPKVGS